MTTIQKSTKALHFSLWIAQLVLGGMFIMAGTMKTFQPIEKLSEMIPWAADVSVAMVRFIGISELLGGLGLILPALLRIKPFLTPIAAIGIATIMIFASVFHIAKDEASLIGMNLILAFIAIFIAWGRSKKVTILPK